MNNNTTQFALQLETNLFFLKCKIEFINKAYLAHKACSKICRETNTKDNINTEKGTSTQDNLQGSNPKTVSGKQI